MKRSILFVFILSLMFDINSFGQTSISEYGILEEYQGRANRTSVGGVDVSAEGSNLAATDNKGLFVLEFEKGITVVNDFDFDKEGYVIFNRDAVKQWNIANNINRRFHVVICKQRDLRNRINEYYGIFDNENKKELDKKKKEISELKITIREKEERYLQLDEEYKRLQREARIQAEKYARTDENALNEVAYKALCLFRENKSIEALKVFDDYGLWEKARNKRNSYSEAKKIEKEQAEDLKSLIPQLTLYIDMLKLGGQRNEDSLIVKLNDLIGIYHELADTVYNQQLALCLYDLGKIHEPVVVSYLSSLLDGGSIDKVEARHQDVTKAVDCFKESASLGYAPAQYCLGKLYETSDIGIYDLFISKNYYTQAAKQGYALAISRLNDFIDFGQRDEYGNMIYYHIKQRNGKKGSVKVTYRDISYASYKGFGDQLNGYNQFEDVSIPSQVLHNGVIYSVTEIGRDAFRLSGVKKLVIPEGVDTISYFSLRSTHDLREIVLPRSLKYVDKECVAWHTGLKSINIDSKNKYYYVGKNGHLYSSKDNSIVLALDTLESWSEGSSFQWAEGEKYPVSVTKQDMTKRKGLQKTSFPSVNIPLDVDTIPVECFYNSKLRTLTIPFSVKEILDEAFSCSNYLYDVVLPNSLKGLRTSSFKSCDMLSDVYCLSPIPPLADINTFEEGPAIRYLHVPKGSRDDYSKAQGWNVFNHIIDDIDSSNVLYSVLSLRSEGKYVEALRYIDENINKPSITPFEKAQIAIQKIMLYYQMGKENDIYTSALSAVTNTDILTQTENPQLLDQLLSYNLISVSVLSENDTLSSKGLSSLADVYEIAIKNKRWEVIETANNISHKFLRQKNNSESISRNVFDDIKSNCRISLMSLIADSLNKEDKFAKDDLTDFKKTAISVLGLSLNKISNELKALRSDGDNSVDETKLKKYFEAIGVCAYVFESIDRSDMKKDLKTETDSVEVSLYSSMNQIAYLLKKGKYEPTISENIANAIYDWCISDFSKPQAEYVLKDVCNYANRPLPSSFTEIPLLINNLENGVIPDSIEKAKTDYYIEYAQSLRKSDDNVNAISYLYKAAYNSPFALRLLGWMCYCGEGIPKNYEYALHLLDFARKKGDVDISSYLMGSIYDKKNDSKSAFEAYSKSNFWLSKLRLVEMYKTGEYVRPDIDKAIEISRSIIASEDGEKQERAKNALQSIAYKLNHIAYEEIYANNLEQAMLNINKAINLLPDDSNLLDSKGEFLLWMGETSQAIELCRKAIQMDPEIIERSSLYKKLKEQGLIE